MREVKRYIAWDDSEFEDCDNCRQYELQAIEAMMSINDCYDFLNKDGDYYAAPDYRCEDVEKWINWLSNAVDACKYIKVRHTLPDNAVWFITREWGYCITPKDFNGKTGLFKYDDFKNKWVKVGE